MLYILNFVFIFIIANITGILYTLKHILLATIENLRSEISLTAYIDISKTCHPDQ